MKNTNPKVDAYLGRIEKWTAESTKLRAILLDCGLVEELKWGKPCYTFQDTNLFVIQGFKEYSALLFCKGVLLKDAKGILHRVGEHTQSARQARFTDVREIVGQEAVLKAYIEEAMDAEKAGVKTVLKKNPEPVPEELQTRLDKSPALKKAFGALTPGRQRGYILHFSAAKQSATRESRVEKCIPQILAGKGLGD